MPIPIPEPGLVIQYQYLWRHEAERGRDNARYPRPCAIVVAVRRGEGEETEVVLAPMTHQPPEPGRPGIELPAGVRRALGLPERTWIVPDEVNAFVWPGFDLVPNAAGDYVWGRLPPALHERLRLEVLAAVREGRLRQTRR
jgi:hypothetical protein